MQASTFLDHPKSSMFSSWSQLEDVAKKLDQGGVLNPPYLEIMQFNAQLENNKAKLSKNLHQIVTPGIDSISMSNICRADVGALSVCTVSDL